MSLLFGAHVPRKKALQVASFYSYDVIQVNTSAPRNWAAPKLQGDESGFVNSSPLVFVHAPYLVNPATGNKELQQRSVECLREELNFASKLNAKGVVVHGGHPTNRDSLDGVKGWVETLDILTCDGGFQVPVLVENTAGGTGAPAKTADSLIELVETLRGHGHTIGVTFDTCHAWAANQNPAEMAQQLVNTVGVDLVHANNSKDPQGSNRDRHENLTGGAIPPSILLEVVVTAHAPTVVETPGNLNDQATDVTWLKRNTQHS